MPSPLLVAGILVALVTLIPFFYVVIYSISVGWHTAYTLIVRPRVGELLSNTGRLTLAAVPLCALIGTFSAWLTERTNLPLRSLWRILLTAPLAVPAFVNSFGWISLQPRLSGFHGAILVVTLSYFPFVYLPVAAAFRGMDPALEESARSGGCGPIETFLRVVTPQLRPAMLGGMLLVALHLLSELGALQMLRFPTFTTAIYDQYQSTFNGPAANMLASVLVAITMLFLLIELCLRGQTRYVRIGAGAPRPPTLVRLSFAMPLALAWLVVLSALALGVPIYSLAKWLTAGTSATFPVHTLIATTAQSMWLAFAGAVVTAVIALPVAWLAVRHQSVSSNVIERSVYIANALPGIVVALALVTVAIRYARPFYQTTPLLILAYVVLFLPFAVVSTRAALGQAPQRLEEASRTLGKSPLITLWRVTLPLIIPGIAAGAALVFLSIVTELTATLLLAPIGTTTLATKFWSNADSIAYGAAAPYAFLMIAISAPATFFLSRELQKSRR